MKILSFLSQKKFICLFFINFLVLVLPVFLFSKDINKSYDSYKTFNNCTSTYIAYDSRKFAKNYYYYYDNGIIISLQKGDGTSIKADVYQFIDDVTYDDGSLLNEKNIACGTYSNLKDSEIAIPESIAKKNNLKIDDTLFINSLDSKIKYIFKDLYNIKEPSITSDECVVFIGSSSPIKQNYVYAGFSNTSNVFNKIYIFSKAKSEFLKTIIFNSAIIVVLNSIIQIIIICFYKKQEETNLKNELISGSKKDYYQSLFLATFFLHIFPSLIALTSLLSLHYYISAIVSFATVFIISLIKIIVLKIKVS